MFDQFKCDLFVVANSLQKALESLGAMRAFYREVSKYFGILLFISSVS